MVCIAGILRISPIWSHNRASGSAFGAQRLGCRVSERNRDLDDPQAADATACLFFDNWQGERVDSLQLSSVVDNVQPSWRLQKKWLGRRADRDHGLNTASQQTTIDGIAVVPSDLAHPQSVGLSSNPSGPSGCSRTPSSSYDSCVPGRLGAVFLPDGMRRISSAATAKNAGGRSSARKLIYQAQVYFATSAALCSECLTLTRRMMTSPLGEVRRKQEGLVSLGRCSLPLHRASNSVI